VKTTLELPDDVWRATKIQALDHRTDFRSVVIAALKAHLKLKAKPARNGRKR
jgi:hypothetical protein